MCEDDEIILIEDDEDRAAVVKSVLRKNLPGKIRHFDDGESALTFLFSGQNKSIKLILLDLILPKVDGVEIFRRIKADAFLQNIPVMILTSSEQTRQYVESLGLQPDGYVAKPPLKKCA